jgi:hypothetical protein
LGWFRDDDDRERFASAQGDAVAAIESQAFPFDGSLLDRMPTTAAPLLPADWDVI